MLLPINTKLLFVSKYCPPCVEAKLLVPSDAKIIDVQEHPIMANRYNVSMTPTYIIINSGQIVKRMVGLEQIRAYCYRYNQEASFTGVLYFTNNKIVNNLVTKGILRRIKRLNVKLQICDPSGELAKEYNVIKLPTFIFVEDDKEIGRYTGIINNDPFEPKP